MAILSRGKMTRIRSNFDFHFLDGLLDGFLDGKNFSRNKEPQLFQGDLMEEEAVLEWLTNLEAMELADKIEEVNGKILETLIKEKDYLAVLFCEYNSIRCKSVVSVCVGACVCLCIYKYTCVCGEGPRVNQKENHVLGEFPKFSALVRSNWSFSF